MIDARELMIGNYLIPSEPEHGKKPFRIDAGDILQIRKGMQHYQYEPIPLTPEILIACGFKMRNEKKQDDYYHNYWLPNNYCISHCVHGTDIHDEGKFYCGKSEVEVKTLHQLQNLYYALTQTELGYKPLNN